MIGLFTDPQDEPLVELIRAAADEAAPQQKLEVYPLEQKSDERLLEGRNFVNQMIHMSACILDCDQLPAIVYAAELGSIGATIAYYSMDPNYNRSEFNSIVQDLDRRILLLSRRGKKSEIARYFGNYYALLPVNAKRAALKLKLVEWIRDTVDRTSPKVFISYRSTQISFARRVTDALRRRGALVWFAETSIKPGQSIPTEINRGIGWATHLVPIVDATYFESQWARAEFESLLFQRYSDHPLYRGLGTGPVIPIFLVDPSDSILPPLVRRIRGIDGRVEPFSGVMTQLWHALTAVGLR